MRTSLPDYTADHLCQDLERVIAAIKIFAHAHFNRRRAAQFIFDFAVALSFVDLASIVRRLVSEACAMDPQRERAFRNGVPYLMNQVSRNASKQAAPPAGPPASATIH